MLTTLLQSPSKCQSTGEEKTGSMPSDPLSADAVRICDRSNSGNMIQCLLENLTEFVCIEADGTRQLLGSQRSRTLLGKRCYIP